jgi:hypothetical protein
VLDTCVRTEQRLDDSDSDSDCDSDSDSDSDSDVTVSALDGDSWPRLLLGIHNIDGSSLRSPDVQTALSYVFFTAGLN